MSKQAKAEKKQSPVKKIIQTVTTVLLILCTVLCFFVVSSAAMKKDVSIFGFRLFYVVSGSMEPTIPVGTLLLVGEDDEYAVDDVITFYSGEESIKGYPNTHRVIGVGEQDGQRVYQTKGDANNVPDAMPVKGEDVIGRVYLQINGALFKGLLEFLGTPAGFFALVLLPILLVSIMLMRSFKQAIKAETQSAEPDAPKGEQEEKEECQENETKGNDTTE